MGDVCDFLQLLIRNLQHFQQFFLAETNTLAMSIIDIARDKALGQGIGLSQEELLDIMGGSVNN